jgi:hypothetical protein
VRNFWIMMGVQFVSYCNLTINYRAIAHEQYVAALFTDGAASAISYFIVRKINRTDSKWAMWGMIIGGGVASTVGIWLTRQWS